jgi:2-polyprenyl-3-methyl-5-hydroxy-6-metoxy-1,4-benzoquinol methylase
VGKPGTWQRRVEEFVLGRIGDPPARVLEVGCGEGELALVLTRAGYSVTAIDPKAPEGPIFRRATIEEFSDPGRFDYVVAILSLHHVEDIGMFLDNVVELLRADGAMLVVEFAWDRIDAATAEWLIERLPNASSEGHSWLGCCCQGERSVAEWATERGFHSSRRMREELGRRFVVRHFEWVPYLYPDLGEDVSEADEKAAVESGTINATGFRYVGTKRSSAVL